MSNYNKSVNFAVKDTLPSGDPNKVVSGAEIDTEFNNIASSSSTKIDKVPSAVSDNVPSITPSGGLQDSGRPSSALIPSGGIIMWSGLISAIPTGWALCDGTNGTPDLRNRFVVGAGDQYNRNDVGGADSVTLSEDEMPRHGHTTLDNGSHNHTGATGIGGSHTHSLGIELGGNGENENRSVPSASDNTVGINRTYFGATDSNGNHNHSIEFDGQHSHVVTETGGDQAHENRPPYFALAFIMKL